MKRSLNEIEQTCRKAARGCGLSWGVADEVGKSIRWLHIFQLDGITNLVALLEQLDHHHSCQHSPSSLEGVWKAPEGVLSSVMAGISLCDCVEEISTGWIETENIAYPLLAAGFLGASLPALTAPSTNPWVQLEWSSVILGIQPDTLVISGNIEDLYMHNAPGLTCRRSPVVADCRQLKMHIGDAQVDGVIWQRLEDYAYRTYVEATEKSRLSGAGAGLNDND